jgi:phosphoglycolate phosphatase-like HAD superfamily hydrolase
MHVEPIVGRPYAELERMKPNPELVLRAVFALDSKPATCVFIGDSLSDIAAAQAARIPFIGYANKPHKAERFAQGGADVVATSMADIAQLVDDE